MLDRLRRRWHSHPQLMVFLAAVALGAVAGPIFETTFNNYLNDTFGITAEQRGVLEGPRELPGFLVTVSAGLLAFLPDTRIAVVAALLAAVGMAGLGLNGGGYGTMMAFMIVHSAGIHLSMPVHNTIGLDLARRNQEGRRLGQIRSVGVAASIIGCLLVWLLLGRLKLDYRYTFLTGAAAHGLSAVVLLFMRPTAAHRGRARLVVKARYWLFYALSFLFGARKQIFITFAPWVLLKVYGQPPSVFAWLWMVSSILGIGFQPWLGRLVDHVGERRVLMADAALLIVVCAGYGYADHLGLGRYTVWALYACFVADQLLFATGMARSTYLKKIALAPEHVGSTLALGVTIDHTVSMSIPRWGGRVWDAHGKHGYRYVFVGAAVIALLNLLLASLIRVPERAAADPVAPPVAADGPTGQETLPEGGAE